MDGWGESLFTGFPQTLSALWQQGAVSLESPECLGLCPSLHTRWGQGSVLTGRGTRAAVRRGLAQCSAQATVDPPGTGQAHQLLPCVVLYRLRFSKFPWEKTASPPVLSGKELIVYWALKPRLHRNLPAGSGLGQRYGAAMRAPPWICSPGMGAGEAVGPEVFGGWLAGSWLAPPGSEPGSWLSLWNSTRQQE